MEVHFSKKITKNIQNKKVLITGAGTGLGRYMAYYLHILGANLLLVGRTEHTLRETQALCKSSTSAPEGSAVEVHAADLSAWDEAHAAVKRAVQIFGTLDVVVANAGQSMYENIADCQPIVFEAMMKNNYYSAVNIISHALEHITQSSGIVCAITSIQSFIGVPYHAPYCAAKHAVTGYLETLELELPKISVVEIIPGWIEGTALRTRAIDGKGSLIPNRAKHKRHRSSSIDAKECARAAVEGIAKKTRCVYRQSLLKIFYWLNFLCHGF